MIERPNSRVPDWDNVKRIARRFGGSDFDELAFKAWVEFDPAIVKAA
jgi:hypothetical protein